MPDEVEEIQPADDVNETIGGDLEPIENPEGVEGGEPVDVSDSLADASVVSGQEEVMGEAPAPSGPAVPLGPVKPKSNIFTLILILSFLCMGLAIYLIAYELNNFYSVTFGGLMSPPNKTVETAETGK